ncbi:indole-3-glycerol phosphate synthase TrpC [Pelosinus sp. sgz500959]|uniref:indole-3-glycerol phosphate synthase TrpC n=1 Tax=Pelosinus sp. sgz500959 TaxID=3242472 RepID=UPI00366CB3CB
MLNKITEKKREAVKIAKEERPLARLLKNIMPGSFAFSKAIKQSDWALIAECKLVSPAKGQLCTDYSVTELAQLYTKSGATALSVHTDTHFSGQLEDIAAVRAVTSLPILRKDFIIDEYQIYESRVAGADAILLIVHILSDEQLKEYISIAHGLGMDCLVEVHTLEELERAQQTVATLMGINNRNLETFITDVQNTFDLLPYCDKRRIVISESGVSTGDEAYRLEQAGVRGILVGEGLVKATDIGSKTRELSKLNQINGGRAHA